MQNNISRRRTRRIGKLYGELWRAYTVIWTAAVGLSIAWVAFELKEPIFGSIIVVLTFVAMVLIMTRTFRAPERRKRL